PPRLGVTVGLPMRDSGTREILATLREASRHAVAVVDLEDGQAWWETRLLVLSAGSVRRGHPSVVVFVATEEGVERRFQGWALATDVERGLLAARDDLRLAYERAAVAARRWDLALPPTVPNGDPGLPWPTPDVAKKWVVFPRSDSGLRNELAAEQ